MTPKHMGRPEGRPMIMPVNAPDQDEPVLLVDFFLLAARFLPAAFFFEPAFFFEAAFFFERRFFEVPSLSIRASSDRSNFEAA